MHHFQMFLACLFNPEFSEGFVYNRFLSAYTKPCHAVSVPKLVNNIHVHTNYHILLLTVVHV